MSISSLMLDSVEHGKKFYYLVAIFSLSKDIRWNIEIPSDKRAILFLYGNETSQVSALLLARSYQYHEGSPEKYHSLRTSGISTTEMHIKITPIEEHTCLFHSK